MLWRVLRRSISASVREVVAFVLRSGDLGGSGKFAGRDRALEGTRGHQRVQRKRPADYQAEVPVAWTFSEERFDFTLRGRIDGVQPAADSFLVEEIKTVHKLREGMANPLHWAQVKIYACLYARDRSFERATIVLTYLELESNGTVQYEEKATIEELQTFFDRVLGEYLQWVRAHQQWCDLRDESIRATTFPFPEYREGQRHLAVAVYRTIKQRARIFAEAPTGIGKTISTLFPAVKAMAEGHVEKIFYATAKTSGRKVAEEAFEHLEGSGLKLRRVTLTARDKICFNNGQPCDVKSCPFALGYYDRIKSALQDGLAAEAFDRVRIEAIAQKHRVCPFELSLDLSIWADAVICDYNYVFDPSVSLDRYFDGEKHEYAILIDEAHNLIDRSRGMFSAEIVRHDLEQVAKLIEAEVPACAKALGKLCAAFRTVPREEGWAQREDAWIAKAPPAKFAKALEKFLGEAELWLAQEQPSAFREELLNTYFNALTIRNVTERFDERHVAIYDPEPERVKLFCVDPSLLLQEALKRTGSAAFFSATLRPVEYFRQTLGGDLGDRALQLTSPFPGENLCLLIHDGINTRFRGREQTYDTVAASIGAIVNAKPGKYLVFFPSYAYLAETRARFSQSFPAISLIAQSSSMSDPDREDFLRRFSREDSAALAGFAVLGGVFGEGIDLAGDRLIGAVIVGVGLPQLCLERDLIKEHFQRSGISGFDFAYTFPGMNRVLQAVGRVIRSESDRGVVLLIDDRFRQRQYQELLPSWWAPRYVRSADEAGAAAARFWSDTSTE